VKKPPVKKAPVKKTPAKKTPAKKAPPATRPYVVVDGDTLIDICAEHKVRLAEVLALNHLRKDSTIRPGRKLLLPAPAVKTSPGSTFLGRTYPPAVVAAAGANRKVLARRTVPSREQVRAMIVAEARRRDIDPALALAVAYQESGFNQRVVSPANAVGVMQVIPSAGKWASDLIDSPLDLLNTRDNITAGVVLLAALSEATDDEAQAIAGYYQGLTSVRNNGMFDDTRRYVANVQTLKSRFAKTV
jgi:soluble lytic murein transglycosylase-like protein